MEDDDDDNKATLGTDFERHKFTDVNGGNLRCKRAHTVPSA